MSEFRTQNFNRPLKKISLFVLSIFIFESAQAAPVCSELFEQVTISRETLAQYGKRGESLKAAAALTRQATSEQERGDALVQVAVVSNEALDFIVQQLAIARDFSPSRGGIAALRIGSNYLFEAISQITSVPIATLIGATVARLARIEKPAEKMKMGFHIPGVANGQAREDETPIAMGFAVHSKPLTTPYGRETEYQPPERAPVSLGFQVPNRSVEATQNSQPIPIGFGERKFDVTPKNIRVEFHSNDGLFHIQESLVAK